MHVGLIYVDWVNFFHLLLSQQTCTSTYYTMSEKEYYILYKGLRKKRQKLN